MDPDVTLARLRRLANDIIQSTLGKAEYEMADLFEDLDAWMSSGGFLPEAWSK